MKKRETINLCLHIGLGLFLTALVLYHRYFLLFDTFIYAWLREQAQHRDDGFFAWMTWHRMFEVFQWVIGCAVALGLYEIFFV